MTPEDAWAARISPEQLLDLLREVEAGDPIDYADLATDEDALRRLAVLHMCERFGDGAHSPQSALEQRVTLLAVATRLVLENLVLNLRLLAR